MTCTEQLCSGEGWFFYKNPNDTWTIKACRSCGIFPNDNIAGVFAIDKISTAMELADNIVKTREDNTGVRRATAAAFREDRNEQRSEPRRFTVCSSCGERTLIR